MSMLTGKNMRKGTLSSCWCKVPDEISLLGKLLFIICSVGTPKRRRISQEPNSM